jgi:hypothetical protein
MAKRPRLDFGLWVPMDARRELARQAGLPSADYLLLKRLASREMKPGVWDRLPRLARGNEGLVIVWTCSAAEVAAKWRAEPSYGNPPAESAANHAEWLASAMRDSMLDASDRWQALWRGDSSITFEMAVSFVDQLTAFYRRLDADSLPALSSKHPSDRGDARGDRAGRREQRGSNAQPLPYARIGHNRVPPLEPPEPLTVTFPTGKKISGLGLTTLWKLGKEGRIELVHVGRRTLITFRSLKALLTPQAASEPEPRRKRGRPRKCADTAIAS